MTTAAAVATMKAAQVSKGGADFEVIERDIPEPGAGQVRIKVHACGVCHSDVLTKDGLWPGIQYPRVPGHEVAGVIDELGAGVTAWGLGQRVGVGWHGGQDNTCAFCRRGDFRNCRNMKVPGISYDGGYQQYMVAPVEALAAMPAGEASLRQRRFLLCAGITTYNALRHSGAMPGDLVAVLGVGGLGHLGIQFANKFGYKVAAIGRGADDATLARTLGATEYIDNKTTNAAEALQKMGGAQVILATAPNSKTQVICSFRRFAAERQAHGDRCGFRTPCDHTATAHYRKSDNSRLGRGNRRGLGRYSALRGTIRCASYD